jgi:hypothetical protein
MEDHRRGAPHVGNGGPALRRGARRAGFLLVAFVLGAAPQAADGQTGAAGAPPGPEATQALNRALEDGGVEAGLEVARVAIRQGRYEQAAGILTGLQARDPQNPTVKLLLGDLYTRMGARAQAKIYLRQALESERLAGEARRNAEALLAFAEGAGGRGARDWQFAGTLRSGLRYSSNANGGTTSDTILIGDVARETPNNVSEEDDASGFLYAFGRATKPVSQRVSLDARGFVYGRKQVDLEDQDLAAARVQPGVVWDAVKTRAHGLRLRPYAIVALTGVGREHALTQLGGGVRALERVGRDWFFDQTLEWSDVNYRNTDERPSLDQLDGDDGRLELGVTHRLTDSVSLRLSYRVSHRDTRETFLDRTRQRIRLAGSTDLPTLWSGAEGSPTLRGGIAYLDSAYDGPDPSVSPTITRADTEWAFDVGLTLPVRDGWSVEVGADYTRTDSNLPNYDRDEVGATAGVRLDF